MKWSTPSAPALARGGANELAGNEQFGDNFWSDFIGSMAGATTVGVTNATLGAVGNVIGGATGSPTFVDNVAGEDVALRLAASSTDLADQFAANGGKPVDARGVAAKMRRPAEVEQIVPGYRANIADRTGDPGMATFAFNQDGISSGAANSRRARNTRVIDDRMGGLAPQGDPALFRAELDAARDAQIAQATDEVDVARLAFDDSMQRVEPDMTDATARGSSLRGALADRYAIEQDKVRQAYRPINEATVPVDVAPLASRFEETTGALPTNDRERFMPSEARIPSRLVEPEVPPSESAILGPDGRPLIKPGTPARGEVPLNEVTSIRGGLTDDVRAARATPGQANKARVTDLYRRGVDDFVDQAVPAELRDQLDTARTTRRDVADRFERPGTGIAETLRTREGGGYALDDSAVPGRFVQPDSGRVTDFRAMMQEAGADPRARSAVTDEVLSRVKQRGLIDKPVALGKFIDENSIVLGEFPDLKTQLQQAGASKEALSAAEKASAAVTKRLTTPGKSATASYLKFDVEATRDAINNLTRGPQPRKAAQELLETVGNTPEARENLRTAFWDVVKGAKNLAADVNGEKRWSVNALGKIFDDPKTAAVADELWADNPKHLADIKEVFAALANVEVSGRARAAGSSGTGQILKGGFDPSLSATSIASRMRSVNRGQMTPSIAVLDIGSTWLRNRSKQVQANAINAIASAAVNNPEMAADLLEKFNPADFAAKRRMLTQKYGVRATQIINLLDEAMAEDPTMDAIMESDDDR
ncbi:hypothetical protein VQ045_19135 [Aurantimonas sp. E1-2-R+4]|uniref:hypothetical protein n=1 Tax=Aurantimonas sp. E1-2-R+4 TaxID=3113714 RepID=UPI002F92590D